MDKAKKNLFCPDTRRLIQLYSALLHNAYLRGFISGEIYRGSAKYVCAPGLNCYSCPGASFSCPLGALQNALSSTGHRAPWYILGILMLLGVMLGRTVCGWLCPAGLLQELLHRIPTVKLKKSRFTRLLTVLKYVILAVFVVALPLVYGLAHGLSLPAFCKYLCPAGTLEGSAVLLSHPANSSLFGALGLLFTNKWIIMLIIGLSCVFCFRSFCRFLCPLGALYSLFNRFCLIGIQTDTHSCTGCGACVRYCKMDVLHPGDRECIQCGQCMKVCGSGAIRLQAGRIILAGSETGREKADRHARKTKVTARCLRYAAVILLCLVLLWFNFLDPSVRSSGPVSADPSPQEIYLSDAPTGWGPGDQLADFSLFCYDGSEFRLSDTRGKVTFINLWATYCAPCLAELPYFSELYTRYAPDLAMLVVHPSLVTDDPQQYLADKNYPMPCATDTADDIVASAVGFNGTLPRTVVLDRRGEVIYNAAGSVTYEQLKALYEEAKK